MRKSNISFVLKKEIDHAKWDRLIGNAFNSQFYAFYDVMDVLAKDWGAFVVDDFVAAMPVGVGRKYGVSYLYQPTFSPFTEFYCENESLYNDISITNEDAITTKYLDLIVRTDHAFKVKEAQLKPKVFQVLDLKKKLHYNTNTKRNLKKAEGYVDAIQITNDIEGHVEMFRRINGPKIDTLYAKDFETMLNFLMLLDKKGLLKVYECKDDDGNKCASASFIFYKDVIYYFKGVANEFGREKGLMHQIMNMVIIDYKDSYDLLNFLGSNTPGVATFNKGFGGEDRNCFSMKINKLSFPFSLLKK